MLFSYLVCTVNLTLSFSERASEMSTWRGCSESELRSTSAVLRLGITLTPSMVIVVRSDLTLKCCQRIIGLSSGGNKENDVIDLNMVFHKNSPAQY